MAGLRRTLAAIGAVLCVGCSLLEAAPAPSAVPLPPRRDVAPDRVPVPEPKIQEPSPPPRVDATSTPVPRIEIGEAEACSALLAGGKVVAERQAAVGGPDGCGIAIPVRVSAIVLGIGRRVALEPPPVLRCSFADALADWTRDDLAPLLALHGGGLVTLKGTGGYECRGRNRIAGAKLSQHGVGNAMDLQAIVLADGTSAHITQTARNPFLFAEVKLTACTRFATVLGPGSDGYHDDNLHLDLETRRNGAHYCHWQLP